MPYYLLINRKGQIVDFGTTARPSNPQFVSRIDDASNNFIINRIVCHFFILLFYTKAFYFDESDFSRVCFALRYVPSLDGCRELTIAPITFLSFRYP